MRRALIRIGLTLLVVVGLLGLLLWLNPVLRERLLGQERHRFPVAEIQCAAPPGLSRTTFLEEVQYYAELPSHVDRVRADLKDHLTESFARHPWVKSVDSVRVKSDGGIEVRLTFRRPVLAVRVGKELRAVDVDGILLPRNPAALIDLPILDRDVNPPQGPEGTPWGDARVEQAAKSAPSR